LSAAKAESTRDRQLGVLTDVSGLDVVELGCGTAYLSAWLARRGARPAGVDVTPAQLTTARRCQDHFGISFPLIEADAGNVPLPGDSFDLAISECGASLWCEPARWVPEAARLLRPGGRLVFHTTSILVTLCLPQTPGPALESLQRSQREAYRLPSPTAGWSTTQVTATGSASCAQPGSPSTRCTRCTPRRRGHPPLLPAGDRRLGPAVARRRDMGDTPDSLTQPRVIHPSCHAFHGKRVKLEGPALLPLHPAGPVLRS
jgi:SAM-dependent methyltransferase